MADAAAPAPELKEYPEFPGQKLSKRYVYCVSCCRCHHHRHHHHHHRHHHRFGFLHTRFRNTHLLLLSRIQKHTQNFSEYKKMLKRQKADEEKAAKAAAKVRLLRSFWELFHQIQRWERWSPSLFFFQKTLSSFLSSLLRPIYKNFFCFLCFAPYGCCCWKEEVLT